MSMLQSYENYLYQHHSKIKQSKSMVVGFGYYMLRYETIVQQACHPENFLPDNFIPKENVQTLK
jgi:hypothetical protein